ncbi:hypothetical protein GCM10020001_024310 [Nonomuraea salmonea]
MRSPPGASAVISAVLTPTLLSPATAATQPTTMNDQKPVTPQIEQERHGADQVEDEQATTEPEPVGDHADGRGGADADDARDERADAHLGRG